MASFIAPILFASERSRLSAFSPQTDLKPTKSTAIQSAQQEHLNKILNFCSKVRFTAAKASLSINGPAHEPICWHWLVRAAKANELLLRALNWLGLENPDELALGDRTHAHHRPNSTCER